MVNHIKTVLLLGALAGLLIGIGGAIGGRTGAAFGLVMAAVMNFTAYWFSDKIALRMSGAKAVSEQQAPDLYAVVRKLCSRADLPVPALYVIPSAQPNAFATGRNPKHAAVAVTEGIVSALSPRELEGVIAHELGHVRNRDILIASIAATIAGAISWIAMMARWGAMFGGDDDDEGGGLIPLLVASIVTPIAALVVQMAISRSREYLADRAGAELSQDPLALAEALKKIEVHAERSPMKVNPAAASMFIVNPLRAGFGKGIAKAFSTHPPTTERVRRLEEMAGISIAR